jgi:hypothetical protein
MYVAKKIVVVIGLTLLVSIASWAALNGDVEGVVKDSTGALVPGALVTITSTETGAQRTMMSDERGHFIATSCPSEPMRFASSLQVSRQTFNECWSKVLKRQA